MVSSVSSQESASAVFSVSSETKSESEEELEVSASLFESEENSSA